MTEAERNGQFLLDFRIVTVYPELVTVKSIVRVN